MHFVGVDIGGTKVAAGLVDASGNLLFETSRPMRPREGFRRSIARVEETIGEALEAARARRLGVEGIGVCAAGPLDYGRGLVMNPPNLPGWKAVPLAAMIGERFGLEARLENDANACALAEMRWGAARGHRNVLLVTLGTGIGTALVVDGKLYRGRKGMAGEGGHMTVNFDARGRKCVCGNVGCIEAFASGPAVERRARRLVGRRKTMLRELCGGRRERLTMSMIGRAAARGDALALELVEGMGRTLGIWLGGLVNLLDPDIIVVGGGVSTIGGPLFGSIGESLLQHTVNPYAAEVPLVPAALGPSAGICGGAALFLD